MSLLLLANASVIGDPQYVRHFNPGVTVSDHVETALGTTSLSGGITFAALVYHENRGTAPGYAIRFEDSSNANSSYFGVNTNGTLALSNAGTAGVSSSSGSVVLPVNSWSIIAVTKDTGGSTPRFHIYNIITDNWVHGDGSIPVGAPTNTPAHIHIGNSFHGQIGVGGIWNSNLTDIQVEALSTNEATSDWFSHAVAPAVLWQLNQTVTTSPVLDRTGGGADETTLVGTTTNFVPVPWQFGILQVPGLLLPSPTLLPSGSLLPGSLLSIASPSILSQESFGFPLLLHFEDYPNEILGDSPSAYWRMGDSGSSMVATVGPNGAFENAPSPATPLIEDSTNQATRFVATSLQRAIVPDNTATDLGDNFTIEAWVSIPNISQSEYFLDQTGGGPGLRFDGVSSRFVLTQGTTDCYQIDYIPTANRPLHLFVTKSGSTLHAAVNGFEYSITTLSAVTYTNGVALYVGSNRTSTFSNVTLDELALYKSALPISTALQHYSLGGTETITAWPGIVSAEAFGTPLLPRTVVPFGIDSEEFFGNLIISGPGQITTFSIPSSEIFGSHFVGYIVVPPNDLLRRLSITFVDAPYNVTVDEPGTLAAVLDIDPNP